MRRRNVCKLLTRTAAAFLMKENKIVFCSPLFTTLYFFGGGWGEGFTKGCNKKNQENKTGQKHCLKKKKKNSCAVLTVKSRSVAFYPFLHFLCYTCKKQTKKTRIMKVCLVEM